MNATVTKFRELLANYDHEVPGAVLPRQSTGRKTAATHNAFDAALETANAIFAGTPAGWVSGGVSAVVGLGKIFAGAFLLPTSTHGRHRIYMSGTKLILAGAAATLPGVGTYVNAALAAKDAVDVANYTIPVDR